MSGCTTSAYEDPDAYFEALQTAHCRSTVIEAGRFLGRVAARDLGEIRVCRGESNLSQITLVEPHAGRVVVGFIPGLNSGTFVSGTEVPRNSLVVRGARRGHVERSLGPSSWATISLPAAIWAQVEKSRTAMMGPEGRLELVMPSAHSMQRLLRLHTIALAARAPGGAGNLEAAMERELEGALVDALADCLVYSSYAASPLGQGCHDMIVMRFSRLLETRPQHCFQVAQVCETLKIASRTLRAACHEHLGMGPKRFVDLRRLHLVHQTLMTCNPSHTTVTGVATDHDFWELGRFAGAYKALFGELPSTTRRRAGGLQGQPHAIRPALPDAAAGRLWEPNWSQP
jgi:AraC-like DNA-binding protein